MKVKDITESSITQTLGPDITHREYNRLINDLKARGGSGNKHALATLRKVQQMWSDGDRLLGNYKSLLDDLDNPTL